MEKILVIGIGNIGRADDGLGWAFLDKIADDERFDIQYRYQLQVEDAELISNYKRVWFIDASHDVYPEGYKSGVVKPEAQFSYTSHALPPSAIVQLCHEIYGAFPSTFLLGISGKEWGLRNGMSEIAKVRLEKAFEHFIQLEASSEKITYSEY